MSPSSRAPAVRGRAAARGVAGRVAAQHVRNERSAAVDSSHFAQVAAPDGHWPRLKQSQASKAKKKKEDDSPYRASVSLPQTEFNQRAMATKREPELQKFWEEERIYEDLAENNRRGLRAA